MISGLLETALYVDDMSRAVRFFEEVLELRAMSRSERLTAFDAGSGGTLLVFKNGASLLDIEVDSGIIPGHDGRGSLHMAFSISDNSYEEWLTHLRNSGAKMRSEVKWERGGRSIYFEDPDGHILELATPGLWPNY